MGNWFIDLIRIGLGLLDKALFSFMEMAYNLFITLANITMISSETITEFSNRIYALFGILMLFKLSFSFLNYIVNPDNFVDSEKGFSKIVMNIMIVLVAIIAVPFIFDFAYYFQSALLEENVVAKIILGNNASNADTSSFGAELSFSAYIPFFNIDAANLTAAGANGANCDVTWVVSDTGFYQVDKDCAAEFEGLKLSTYDNGSDYIKYLNRAAKIMSINMLLDNGVINEKSEKLYIINYTPIIPIFVGLGISVLLVLFSFDVAVRSIKLAFLQMVAPVPLMAYIDPTKGKEITENWIKECLKCYVDLFIRLAAIFFAVFLIQQITLNPSFIPLSDSGPGMPTGAKGLLVKVFMMIGCFLFAKQFPELLGNVTGIKLDGGGFFKTALAGLAVAGGVAGTFAGGAVGAATGAVSRFNAGGIEGESMGQRLGGAVRGGITGAGRGGLDAAKNKGKFTGAGAAGRLSGQRRLAQGDTSLRERMGERTRANLGMQTNKERLGIQIEEKEQDMEVAANMGSMKSDIETTADNFDFTFKDISTGKDIIVDVKSAKQRLDDLVNSDASTADVTAARIYHEKQQEAAYRYSSLEGLYSTKQTALTKVIKDQKDFIMNNKDNKVVSKILNESGISDVANLNKVSLDGHLLDYGEFKKMSGIGKGTEVDIKRDIAATKASDEYRRSEAVDAAVKKQENTK